MANVRSPALALLPLDPFCRCAAPTVLNADLIGIDILGARHVGAYRYAKRLAARESA